MKREQRHSRVIIFFGPDGAGKSTQAWLLLKYLRLHGYRTRWAWIRGRHSLAFLLANLLAKIGYYRIVEAPPGTANKVFDPKLLPKFQSLWGFIEFASVLPWIFLRVQLPKLLGYTVVADRYVVDTVVYLGYWLGQDIFRSSLAKVLLSLIPTKSVLIYLDAETEILSERTTKDIIPKDFLVFQQRFYPKLAHVLRAAVIDTSNLGVDETFRSVIKILNYPQVKGN